jgi:ATP-dependent Clp protease ATP-binding subunit ClpA
VAAGDLDSDALASLGIDLDAVRARADTVFGVGALDRAGHRSPGGHLPFAAEAKKTLELALREAVRLHSNSITANHLLLGLIRNTGCTADETLRRSLVDVGLEVAGLRSVIERAEAQAS